MKGAQYTVTFLCTVTPVKVDYIYKNPPELTEIFVNKYFTVLIMKKIFNFFIGGGRNILSDNNSLYLP